MTIASSPVDSVTIGGDRGLDDHGRAAGLVLCLAGLLVLAGRGLALTHSLGGQSVLLRSCSHGATSRTGRWNG
jgi:hypothetical protein